MVPGSETFDNRWLQAIYEVRALLIIAFVLVTVLAQQLATLGLADLATALVLVSVLPLLVVLVGLLIQTSHWLSNDSTA